MILPTGKLLVNGFLIFNNTFTIIVTQRTRELALLRCLGQPQPLQARRQPHLHDEIAVGA